MAGYFNLEKHFTFYASYHNAPMNVLIHLLCIPSLLATGLLLFQVSFELIQFRKLNTFLPARIYVRSHLHCQSVNFKIFSECFDQYTQGISLTVRKVDFTKLLFKTQSVKNIIKYD